MALASSYPQLASMIINNIAAIPPSTNPQAQHIQVWHAVAKAIEEWLLLYGQIKTTSGAPDGEHIGKII